MPLEYHADRAAYEAEEELRAEQVMRDEAEAERILRAERELAANRWAEMEDAMAHVPAWWLA